MRTTRPERWRSRLVATAAPKPMGEVVVALRLVGGAGGGVPARRLAAAPSLPAGSSAQRDRRSRAGSDRCAGRSPVEPADVERMAGILGTAPAAPLTQPPLGRAAPRRAGYLHGRPGGLPHPGRPSGLGLPGPLTHRRGRSAPQSDRARGLPARAVVWPGPSGRGADLRPPSGGGPGADQGRRDPARRPAPAAAAAPPARRLGSAPGLRTLQSLLLRPRLGGAVHRGALHRPGRGDPAALRLVRARLAAGPRRGRLGRRVALASTRGAQASFTFLGRGTRLIAIGGPKMGKLDVPERQEPAVLGLLLPAGPLRSPRARVERASRARSGGAGARDARAAPLLRLDGALPRPARD